MVFGPLSLPVQTADVWSIHFNSPWELDGVRTVYCELTKSWCVKDFNSPWELDGVRTVWRGMRKNTFWKFQFPLGIRWCSDVAPHPNGVEVRRDYFNSPWELDGVRTPKTIERMKAKRELKFQFPLGIRWCSDVNER